MKKKLAKMLALALALSLCLPSAARAAERRVVRVGLHYGSNAVVVGNLANVQGTGYRFGYYDDDLQFHLLGQTEEKRISVAVTQNLYLTSGGLYVREQAGSAGTLGCYHVQLPGSYETYDDARAAADQAENGFVAWVEGVYYARAGSYTSRDAAQEAADALGIEGAGVGETSAYGYSAAATGTTRILFQFDANKAGQTGAFGVEPGVEDGVKAVTSLKGEEYYGGFRFERLGGGDKSTVVNVVDMDDYIRGVIPYEMSPSWPLEALKAQAVCARTYGLGKIVSSSHSGSYHFDICTTTECQVYHGVGRANDVTNQAVDETVGQLIYYNGKVAYQAVYSSSHGGASEDAKNVWGNEVPYLKGKIDPYEADIAGIAGNYNWTKTYTASSLKERLNKLGYLCADIVFFTGTKSPMGNVIEIKVLDSNGKTWTYSRGKVRTVLGVNSIHFTIEQSGGAGTQPGYVIAGEAETAPELSGLYAISADGTVSALGEESYVITDQGVERLEPVAGQPSGGEAAYKLVGNGWGHSVGMSQWGAYAMAKRGMNYQDILKFYYTDVTVE